MGNLRILCQRAGEIEIRRRILISPKHRRNGSDHERNLPVRDAKERGGAAFENVGVGALRFPGKAVEGWESGNASGCSRKNGAEKAQRLGQSFGAPVGIGDKKRGTPQLVRQMGRDQRFRDVVQAGNGDVGRAGTQGSEGAIHRRMAKHGLQSFADGRKYHAWSIRIPRERRAIL